MQLRQAQDTGRYWTFNAQHTAVYVLPYTLPTSATSHTFYTDLQAPPSLRTSTFVMREAATHFSQQAAQAAAAAARAPAGRAVQPSRTPFESPGSVLGSSGSYSVHLARGSLPKPLGVSRLASQRLPGSGALPPRALAPASVQEEEPEPAFKLPR